MGILSKASVAATLILGVGAGSPPGHLSDAAGCPLSVPVPTGHSEATTGVPEPAWDLRCIELVPVPGGGDAAGVVSMHPVPSPFGVSVTPEGRHRWQLSVRLENLPDPALLGPYTTWVAWATPLELDPVVSLGEVGEGEFDLGEVSFSKFMVWISPESSADVDERQGPLLLRGRSPSSLMKPHDLMTQAPSAEEPMGGAPAHDAHDAQARHRQAHHHAAGDHGDPDHPIPPADAESWRMVPGYPGVAMLPGMMALEPRVSPLTVRAPEGETPPAVRPSEVVALPDGGTLDLTADFVSKTVAGREVQMLAFNGQHPGPLLEVAENTTIFVNFHNRTPFPTAIHWHGLRLDNRFDGVPGVTQDPVLPGGSFRYTVHFPDAGIYWYHPHHREDIGQELGLYGNLRVEPLDPDTYGQVSREEVLMLDDLLLDERGIVPFGHEASNFALMGRFGNTFLVNGRTEYDLTVERGEVLRFYLTNAANTRTFNLSWQSVDAPDRVLPVKVVGTDVGRFERETHTRNVVLAPAERYIVEVLFDEPGRWELVNHVQGVNHRAGVFIEERSVLGEVSVEDGPGDADLQVAFAHLREHPDVIAEIDAYRDRFDDPPDLELVLALEADHLPMVVEEAMRWDWVYLHPVEWAGTMPMMNWAVSADDVRWTLREPATGAENMEIDWHFRVGDVVKLRIHNDRGAVHAMHHPIHIHGQRFLVVEQNGVRNPHLAWKDTVLLPPGSTTDILLEISNPGHWMVHCHIAEHLEAGMKFVFDVEGS